ncbi:prepilin-type N-terminal cleavage/methylation domain-containing protein [Flavobacteriales bacterium]|nr:prepilin-type N-terminal cleavage/methylation domain-containing protein [Flavobacteriales bacterium]
MKKKIKAFTLVELLVVLVIIGILVLLALPSLMPLISKAKSTEAKLQLEHIYTLEKNHFYIHSRFSDDLNEIGFEQIPLTNNGGSANYQVQITESSNHTFKAIATSVVDFDGDGIYNQWEIDQDKKLIEIIKD